MHYIDGCLVNDYGEKTLACAECNRMIGSVCGEMKNYCISAVCVCGSFIKANSGTIPKDDTLLKDAYLVKDEYICPTCGRAMFSVKLHNVQRFSFVVTCKCGERFNRIKDINARERQLYGRAMFMPSEKDKELV